LFFVTIIAEKPVQRVLKEEDEMLCGNKSWIRKKSLKETIISRQGACFTQQNSSEISGKNNSVK